MYVYAGEYRFIDVHTSGTLGTAWPVTAAMDANFHCARDCTNGCQLSLCT